MGVDWEPTRIVWDSYNPHPDLSYMPSEVVFLGSGNENPDTFNPEADIAKDLQELVFLYPGFLGPGEDPDVEFEPLLHTGVVSGHSGYFTLVQQVGRGVRSADDACECFIIDDDWDWFRGKRGAKNLFPKWFRDAWRELISVPREMSL